MTLDTATGPLTNLDHRTGGDEAAFLFTRCSIIIRSIRLVVEEVCMYTLCIVPGKT